MARSKYLTSLTDEQRQQLQQRLHDSQTGRCFICDETIDLVLQKGQLDIDHVDPLAEDGLDAEHNFALTHASCNRSKGASNLQGRPPAGRVRAAPGRSSAGWQARCKPG